MKNKRKYNLKQPKYFKGQMVVFKPHYKEYSDYGEIVSVATHYSEKNEGYHIYSILREKKINLLHIGEDKIIAAYN